MRYIKHKIDAVVSEKFLEYTCFVIENDCNRKSRTGGNKKKRLCK